ncbi:hypothetical protein Q4566_06425 [Tamlana sp. 2_MG-2023]|uniref:hypothetical protein n=1 Tax=unclassified Tamlana TaxID=2614803 RepID=UPI0026E25CAF|nr:MULTISPECIES: hypothetical protein [unclassified Tamlana]MDO6759832.1 hypothetical protein [Tamlana sp. 2_MG-2023]MDO6791455.1 hypothetical protein [Tamlana sp. 1_MG-2023]
MKHIFTHSRKGFLLVTLFVTMVSFASDNSFYSIDVAAKKTTLTISSVREGSSLSLKDNQGAILYSETIKVTGNYSREFDLTFLPNGKYMFELDKDLEIREIPFSISSGNAFFNKENEKVVYKPFIRVVGDHLYISKLAIDGEPLEIDIYFTNKENRYKELILSEIVSDETKIERAYKLDRLNLGNYEVVLHSADRAYEKTI